MEEEDEEEEEGKREDEDEGQEEEEMLNHASPFYFPLYIWLLPLLSLIVEVNGPQERDPC